MKKNSSFANKITLFRTLTCPFLYFFLLYFFKNSSLALGIAFAIAVFSEILDIIDGQIARRYQQVSQIGKLLDPLSDSLWHNIAYLGLILANLANPWLLVLMMFRDTTIVFTRFCALLNNQVIAARISGKVKAHALAYYLILTTASSFFDSLHFSSFSLTPYLFYGQWLVASIILFSFYDYLKANKSVLSL